jgi:hypothetical protein
MPVMTADHVLTRHNALAEFKTQVLKEDTDYGVIPGTGKKPTLLKPGAEKLCTLFGLTVSVVTVDKIEDWSGEGHGGEPLFHYVSRCSLSRDGYLIAEAEGSCNSWENKYRYRKDGGLNPNPASIINTVQKMAAKRALVAATLLAVNASEFFTQDIEDMGHGDEAAPRPAHAAPAGDVPACPKCGGAMWDNRGKKNNDTAPDFKCKDKGCVNERGYGTGRWERDGRAAAVAQSHDRIDPVYPDDPEDYSPDSAPAAIVATQDALSRYEEARILANELGYVTPKGAPLAPVVPTIDARMLAAKMRVVEAWIAEREAGDTAALDGAPVEADLVTA